METTLKHNWIHLPLGEKQTILANVAEEKGIDDNAVEKDFWISMVLKAIFGLPCSKGVIFKGLCVVTHKPLKPRQFASSISE